jgi:hypothetical protein
MTQQTFDTLTRRASMLTLGAGLAALAGPLAASAKNKSGKKARKKCKKQVGQCRDAITEQCSGNPDCADPQLPCCDSLGSCNFQGFVDCLADAQ